MDVTLYKIGLCLIREYMRRWQAKIAEYVVGIPIYKLCTDA